MTMQWKQFICAFIFQQLLIEHLLCARCDVSHWGYSPHGSSNPGWKRSNKTSPFRIGPPPPTNRLSSENIAVCKSKVIKRSCSNESLFLVTTRTQSMHRHTRVIHMHTHYMCAHKSPWHTQRAHTTYICAHAALAVQYTHVYAAPTRAYIQTWTHHIHVHPCVHTHPRALTFMHEHVCMCAHTHTHVL